MRFKKVQGGYKVRFRLRRVAPLLHRVQPRRQRVRQPLRLQVQLRLSSKVTKNHLSFGRRFLVYRREFRLYNTEYV